METLTDNELTFNDKLHEYRLNDVVIPSVTQVIKDAGLTNFDWIDPNLLERKADLGTKVHLTTEYYDKSILNLDSLNPVLLEYLESWIKFRKDYEFEPTEIELQLAHPLYRFAGTIDRIGYIKNGLVLLDIKSGTIQKVHEIQTAAYELLYNQGKKRSDQIKRRLAVYIREDGYKVQEFKNKNDANVFLAALTISNYKKGLK